MVGNSWNPREEARSKGRRHESKPRSDVTPLRLKGRMTAQSGSSTGGLLLRSRDTERERSSSGERSRVDVAEPVSAPGLREPPPSAAPDSVYQRSHEAAA